MIDTIAIQFTMSLEPELLAFWTKRITEEPGKSGYYYFTLKTVLSNGAEITGTYRPHSYTRAPLLRLEFSVPHVVFATNVVSVYDLKEALDRVNEIVADIPGLPPLDVWDGTIGRLDVCYDHQVGNLVPFYIRAIQNLNYPHRNTMRYTAEGIKFWCHGGETRFYDKYLESKDPSTKGIMRLEVEIKREKLRSRNIRTVRDLTPDLLFDLLDKELEKLGLLGNSIGTYSSVFDKLAASQGSDAAFYLLGIICASGMMPKKSVVEATNIHPRTLNRRLRALREEHIPITLTDAESPLPPLVNDREAYASRIAQLSQSRKYILPDPPYSLDEKRDQNGITSWACRRLTPLQRSDGVVLPRSAGRKCFYHPLPTRQKTQYLLAAALVERSVRNGA